MPVCSRLSPELPFYDTHIGVFSQPRHFRVSLSRLNGLVTAPVGRFSGAFTLALSDIMALEPWRGLEPLRKEIPLAAWLSRCTHRIGRYRPDFTGSQPPLLPIELPRLICAYESSRIVIVTIPLLFSRKRYVFGRGVAQRHDGPTEPDYFDAVHQFTGGLQFTSVTPSIRTVFFLTV